MKSVPEATRILVIGGGPGGATAATLLARQGFEVTLFEKAHFPRYHIGESLLPSVLQILDLMGAREKMEQFGFQRKEGAFLEWGDERWGLNFGELSENCTYAFQVERADFDHLLLQHAASEGVKVFEGIEVQGLTFDGDRPRSASWARHEAGANDGNGHAGAESKEVERGEIGFDYLVDASGRNGLMATRYLQNRRYHKIFQNVAIWAYWKDADRMATGREGDIACGSIPNGWLWAIPLRDGTTSVGVVVHRDTVVAREGSMDDLYFEAIEESPFIRDIVKPGRMVSKTYTEQDYSYAAQRFCGPGYFMIGDAAAFLDPLLSSGVHLATYSGLLAAAAIGSTYRGEVSAEEAGAFFEKCYRQAYLRFLVFLSAFYDVGRKKESYFWEAQRLTEQDVQTSDLKHAFLKLVTGVKDMSDVQTDAHRLVLETMTKRIDENLTMRRDKMALASMDNEGKERAQDNGRFFNSVEGLFALSEEEAVEGLYVATTPVLRLARVASTTEADAVVAGAAAQQG
ncbi:MAG: NAD(P)/FAD-dependent oxidoreductase [Vicinamibacterales bacterium]